MLQERDTILCAKNPNKRKPSLFLNSFFQGKLFESNENNLCETLNVQQRETLEKRHQKTSGITYQYKLKSLPKNQNNQLQLRRSPRNKTNKEQEVGEEDDTDGGDGKVYYYTYENVRRWTKDVNIFEKDKIFIPINIDNLHWTLAVIFIDQSKVLYYDSLIGDSTPRDGGMYIRNFIRWVADEGKQCDIVIDEDKWFQNSRCLTESELPQQKNDSDCGVFVCMYADFLSDNLPLDFDQSHIGIFRQKISIDMVSETLSYPSQRR